MVATLIVQDENSYASDVTQFVIDAPPGGWQAGDVLQYSVTVAAATARTFTLRNGTTTLSKTLLQAGVATDSGYSEIGYHVIGSTPPAGSLNILISAAQQGTVAWSVIRGTRPGDPLDGFVISAASGSTPHTLPSLTTTEDYTLITGGIIQGSGSAVWTPPSPWVIGADGTRRHGIVTYKGLQETAGPTGTSSWTMPGGNAAAMIYQIAWTSAEPPEEPGEPSGEITVEGRYSTSNSSNLNVDQVTLTDVSVPDEMDRVIVVAVGLNNDNEETVTSVVLNPGGSQLNFTKIGEVVTVDDAHTSLWYLLNPAVGTHSIRATLSAALNTGDDGFVVGAWVLSGVNQETPVRSHGGFASQDSLIFPYSLTTIAGDLALGIGFQEGGWGNSWMSPDTQSFVQSPANDDRGVGAEKFASGTSTTITFAGNFSDAGAMYAAAFIPSGGSGGGNLTVTISNLTSPTNRWVKPSLNVVWHDGENWGAILPTTDGHALVPDLNSMSTGVVIDDRQSSRPTIVFQDGILGVLRGHPSDSRFSSFDSTDDYSEVVSNASVPLVSANLDASPIALAITPNGYLWAAVAESNAIKVSRSTDDGATWGSAQTIVSMDAATGIVAFAVTDTTLVMFATENDSVSGDARYVRRIDQDSVSYSSGSWTSEILPALPSGTTADDHASTTTLPDGRIMVAAKTTVPTADPLIYVLVRSTAGVWTQLVVLENGPDDTVGYTRPNIISAGSEVFVYYGSFGSPTNLYMRKANLASLDIWTPRATIRSDGDWSDSPVLPYIVPSTVTSFPVLAANRDTGNINLSFRDVTDTFILVSEFLSEPYPSASGDVADGAAIIPNTNNPANSVVIGTNKSNGSDGGLYVMDMAGNILSSQTGFAANSVDWRDTTGLSGWDGRILVMTCNRNSGSFSLRFFWFNPTTRALTSAGSIPIGVEPYGTCLGIVSGVLYAYVTERGPDDVSPREFYQASLVRSGDTVTLGSIVRQFTIPSVVEGMVVSDENHAILMSQEDVGLFAMGASPSGGDWSTRLTVDLVGSGHLVADVEDVAIADTPAGPRVLVSSQGDNSYHVYYWDEVAEEYVHEKRFEIARPTTGMVTGTDGLDVKIANLGPSFPKGLIVVHDDGLDPSRFAFVDASLVFDIPDQTIPIYRGSRPITEIYVGSKSIFDLYVGTQ